MENLYTKVEKLFWECFEKYLISDRYSYHNVLCCILGDEVSDHNWNFVIYNTTEILSSGYSFVYHCYALVLIHLCLCSSVQTTALYQSWLSTYIVCRIRLKLLWCKKQKSDRIHTNFQITVSQPVSKSIKLLPQRQSTKFVASCQITLNVTLIFDHRLFVSNEYFINDYKSQKLMLYFITW